MHATSAVRLASAVVLCMLLAGVSGCMSPPVDADQPSSGWKGTSTVSKTDANELILLQEVTFRAPVEDVWRAYTTADGWTAWASPKAEIDLRVGGTIRTAYSGEIGGAHTNTLNIVNYVPNHVLTLKADLSRNWPAIMQQDADRLSNVILFEAVDDGVTRIRSYGIGYSDAPEYDELMKFFISGNERLFANLRAYVENGDRVDWSPKN